jgi:hypothetical protein
LDLVPSSFTEVLKPSWENNFCSLINRQSPRYNRKNTCRSGSAGNPHIDLLPQSPSITWIERGSPCQSAREAVSAILFKPKTLGPTVFDVDEQIVSLARHSFSRHSSRERSGQNQIMARLAWNGQVHGAFNDDSGPA